MKRVCLHIGLVLLILLAVQAEAEAAVNIISGTYAKLENAVNSVKGSLRQTALSLFKLTLTLEVALFGIRIALKRSQLQETIGEFVFLCIFAGFIAAVLLNYEEWTAAVFEGLGKLGSVSALNPATPLRAGGALVDVILDQASYLTGIENIPAAFLLMIAAGIILIVFVFLSCFILITYMEFLILGNAGVILVGLGGSKIFKEFAVNMMRYIFSLGMKFFVLNLVINVGIQFFLQLGIDKLIQGGGSGLYGNLLMAIAAALMLAFISWTLPSSIQGLLQGSAAGGSNPISRTAGMIAAGAVDRSSRGVQGAAAGAGAGYEAYKTAGHQGTSGLSRFGQAGRNLMAARSEAVSNPNTMRGRLRSMGNMAKAEKELRSGGAEGAGSGGSSSGGSSGSSASSAAGSPGGRLSGSLAGGSPGGSSAGSAVGATAGSAFSGGSIAADGGGTSASSGAGSLSRASAASGHGSEGSAGAGSGTSAADQPVTVREASKSAAATVSPAGGAALPVAAKTASGVANSGGSGAVPVRGSKTASLKNILTRSPEPS